MAAEPPAERGGRRRLLIAAAVTLLVVTLAGLGVLLAQRPQRDGWAVTLDGSTVVVKEGDRIHQRTSLDANQLPADIQMADLAAAEAYVKGITRLALAAGTLMPPGVDPAVVATQPDVASTVPPTTAAPVTATTLAPTPAVTQNQVLNMTLPSGHSCAYADGGFPSPPRLTDGKMRGPQGDNGGFVNVEEVLLADVDGDGVARLICSSGAGGTSSAIIILSARTGRATELPYTNDAQSKLPNMSAYRVSRVTATATELRLTVDAHGPDDPSCCPSAKATVTYRIGVGGPKFTGARLTAPTGP